MTVWLVRAGWGAEILAAAFAVALHAAGLVEARRQLEALARMGRNGLARAIVLRLRRTSRVRIVVKLLLGLIGGLALVGTLALPPAVGFEDLRVARSMTSAVAALLIVGLLTWEAWLDLRARRGISRQARAAPEVPSDIDRLTARRALEEMSHPDPGPRR